MNLFNYIKANNFFPDYAPAVKNWKGKMRGKNTRDKPLEFSVDDQAQIIRGIIVMTNEAKQQIIADPAATLQSSK